MNRVATVIAGLIAAVFLVAGASAQALPDLDGRTVVVVTENANSSIPRPAARSAGNMTP